MYFIILPVFFIAVIFLIIFHFRKKKIICRIKCMPLAEKCCILNELATPLGYHYDLIMDIFTSRTDAWQKDYGYSDIYDKAAPFFNMIFDNMKVYFNYNGRTWLIELWKGQYGINTGSEIGLYYSNKILTDAERQTAFFNAAEENAFIDMSASLYCKDHCISHIRKTHWWLTMFLPGIFSNPGQLKLKTTLRFPDYEMMYSFVCALRHSECDLQIQDLCVSLLNVSFTFSGTNKKPYILKRIFRRYIQCKNKLFCMLYRFVTRPFCSTADRLLYLYYYLPFAFKRTIHIKRYKRRD